MRDLAILTFQTLDGVIQAPMDPEEDRSGGFGAGGWAAAYYADIMEQVRREAMAVPYDMLFGRNTYDTFAAHFSAAKEDPMADMMTAARKYVVSKKSPALDWQNSSVVQGDIPAEITALKRQDGPLLQVHGSAGLLKTLLKYDLIDEFRIWNFPVIVGSGKRLFQSGTASKSLKLVKLDRTANGVHMMIYRKS